VSTRPKSLDRQIREEHARHPSVREATRYGARFGLLIGASGIAVDVVSRFLNEDLTPRPQYGLVAALVGLATGVLVAVGMAQVGAAAIRWRRRAALRFWYPDRAA
jgi:hypothetical protein